MNKLSSIPGTKLALKNTQLLISSGISSLDELIGGGLPVGTVFLIQEDATGMYSKVMLRYFLAEGVINGHSIHIVSQDCEPKSFINNLPAEISKEDNIDTSNKVDDKLVIAWRYKEKERKKSQANFSHNYDLTKTMSQSVIDKSDISFWVSTDNYESELGFKNPAYADVLRNVRQIMEEKGFLLASQPVKQNILRILIHSVGSPSWLPKDEHIDKERDLNIFLYYLRALARSAFVVIAVSMPAKVLKEDTLISSAHLSDVSIKLESFCGTELEKNVALTDFQGFFKFLKYPSISCLRNCDPGPTDFVFKMRRKKFEIKMLHLPPDLQDNTNEDEPTVGCGGSKTLEF